MLSEKNILYIIYFLNTLFFFFLSMLEEKLYCFCIVFFFFHQFIIQYNLQRSLWPISVQNRSLWSTIVQNISKYNYPSFKLTLNLKITQVKKLNKNISIHHFGPYMYKIWLTNYVLTLSRLTLVYVKLSKITLVHICTKSVKPIIL